MPEDLDFSLGENKEKEKALKKERKRRSAGQEQTAAEPITEEHAATEA